MPSLPIQSISEQSSLIQIRVTKIIEHAALAIIQVHMNRAHNGGGIIRVEEWFNDLEITLLHNMQVLLEELA